MYLTPTLSIDPMLYNVSAVVDALELINDGEEAVVCCFGLAIEALMALGLTEEEAEVRAAVARNGTVAVSTGAS